MLERPAMQSGKNPRERPINVVIIDHSYLHQIRWTQQFADHVGDFRVILLTDKSPSRTDGNFEVVNVKDVRQNLALDEMQRRLTFPLYRAMLAERAYFDYTTFTARECYSRVTLADIGELIRSHVNALDEVIRTRADLVIGHLADNAIASLAANIAEHYGKPYAAPFPYYWWPDGYIFTDRADQTSSEVDDAYRRFYADPSSIDRDAISRLYSGPRVTYAFADNVVYSPMERIQKSGREPGLARAVFANQLGSASRRLPRIAGHDRTFHAFIFAGRSGPALRSLPASRCARGIAAWFHFRARRSVFSDQGHFDQFAMGHSSCTLKSTPDKRSGRVYGSICFISSRR